MKLFKLVINVFTKLKNISFLKRKRKKNWESITLVADIIFVLLLVTFYVQVASVFNIPFSSEDSFREERKKELTGWIKMSSVQNFVQSFTIQYVEYDPISIDGNTNFTATAIAENWPGDGSSSNPYVIDGFNITNSSKNGLIQIVNTNVSFIINNCLLSGGMFGIYLYNVSNGQISNNTFFNILDYVISLDSCWNNTVLDNTIFNSSSIPGFFLGSGISIEFSEKNTISGNNISNNELVGISLVSSEKNTVFGNTLNQNVMGINLYNTRKSTISDNTISNNSLGILLDLSDNNTISENTITNCDYLGISLESSRRNIISGNKISNNLFYGIIIDAESDFMTSSNNIVSWNDFIGNNQWWPLGNHIQASDNGSKFDPNVFTHNYWNDWTNPDTNGDDIVDEPYNIDGDANNYDYYPLMFSSSIDKLSPTEITYPNGGEIFGGTALIQWSASIDFKRHKIIYSLSYSTDGGKMWIPLASNLTTIKYYWNTTTVADGSTYLIKVVAKCSEGLTEEDISDGTFTIQNPVYVPTPFPIAELTIGISLVLGLTGSGYFYGQHRLRKGMLLKGEVALKKENYFEAVKYFYKAKAVERVTEVVKDLIMNPTLSSQMNEILKMEELRGYITKAQELIGSTEIDQ